MLGYQRLFLMSLIITLMGLSASRGYAQVPLNNAAPNKVAGTDELETVRRVNEAIERGKQYLRSIHTPQKQWEGLILNVLANMDGGITALSTLALLTCGESPEDRQIRQALDYLRRIPPTTTYVVGLSNLVFAEARQARDLPLIQRNVDWLIATAVRGQNGRILGWSYPLDSSNSARPDGSNSQFALLGLYAGKLAGAKIDDAIWRQLRDLYIQSQKKDGPETGYWLYAEDRQARASFTMTVAGVSGLFIAGMGLNENQQGLDPATGIAKNCGRYLENDPIRDGLNWIGNRFAFENAQESKSTYYNIYGIERVGRLSGQRFLGKVDWYRDGCEYLVRTQNRNGSWSQSRGIEGVEGIDGANAISTSFALLFLSKGRTPILISKLAWGDFTTPERGVLIEKSAVPGIVGWNRKHNDARNLTEFASKTLFKNAPLGWQVYDPRRREFNRNEEILAEVGVLVQAPILYITGHEKPVLSGQHKEILKRYIEEGGFVLAEACCGSAEFADGFRALITELFPENQMRTLPPEHAIWRAFHVVPPTEFPKLLGLERGCRTVTVLSQEPLAGYWEDSRFMANQQKAALSRGELAYRLGANIIAYATGLELPKQRLTSRTIVQASEVKSPPKGFLKPVQLRLRNEAAPAPAAMRNLMAYLKAAAQLDVVLEKESLPTTSEDLFKYKFMYLHGRRSFQFTEEEQENLRTNLQAGGILLADSCCGRAEFDQSFRENVKKLFPNQELVSIPLDDELYSDSLTGSKLSVVSRRDRVSEKQNDNGYRELPPFLEGIKIDGRWVIVYSKYDLGCALEGHKSIDCLGHTRESALELASRVVLYGLRN